MPRNAMDKIDIDCKFYVYKLILMAKGTISIAASRPDGRHAFILIENSRTGLLSPTCYT